MLKNSSDQVIGKGSTILHDARNIGEGAQVKLAEGLERSCSGNDLRAGKALYCKIYGGDDFDDEVAAKKASLKDCGKKVSLNLVLIHICIPATFWKLFMPPSHAKAQNV